MDQRDPDERDDAGLDDRELPDEADMDHDDEPDLVPCPHCKKGIYEDSEFCPHCGQYLSREAAPWSTPTWIVIIVAALIVAILIGWIGLR